MVIQPYNRLYLPYISRSLGLMFEYAVILNIDPIIFWNTFVNSNVAKQIERGNPKYLCMSGKELFLEVYSNKESKITDVVFLKKDYFWAGWILTKYQHRKGFKFSEINDFLPIERVLILYKTLHEADETKFYDVADSFFKKQIITNLQKMRKACELSQSELANLSGVDIRSIQMYEQRRNDINKAQAGTLYKLARVLNCNIEDLLEI